MNTLMKTIRRWSATALVTTLSGICFAQNAAPPASDVVIVPYDPAKPAMQQKPDQFYLPYPRFLELWESAKANRKDRKLENAPVAFVLSTSRYEGVLGERLLAGDGGVVEHQRVQVTVASVEDIGDPEAARHRQLLDRAQHLGDLRARDHAVLDDVVRADPADG